MIALTNPKAAGQRFILASNGAWFLDMAKIVEKEFSKFGYKVSTFQVPNPVVWLVSFWDSDAGFIYPHLGYMFAVDNSKSKEVLGIKYRNYQDSLIEMGNSLIDFGFVPDLRKTAKS